MHYLRFFYFLDYYFLTTTISLFYKMASSSSSEIVVAEPFHASTSGSSYNREYISSDTTPFTRSITFGRHYTPDPFDSEKLPVTLVSEIQRFLRVANLIEFENPRVAYICKSALRVICCFCFTNYVDEFNYVSFVLSTINPILLFLFSAFF